MRKIKSISLTALTLSFLMAVTACGKGNTPADTTTTAEVPTTTVTPTTTEPTKEVDYPEVEVAEVETLDYTQRFSSIAIDTSNAKTLYYMGESFDATGIVVTGYFVQSYSDGTNKSVTKTMKNVSYNLENVDFNNAGTYNVLVQARDNATVQERTFKITVQSSELAASGEEYIGGIDVKYDGGFRTDLLLGDTFEFDSSKVSATLKWYKSGEFLKDEVIDVSKLTVDSSSLDVNTVGTYIVKYIYEGNPVTYKGKEYPNTVKTYTMVDVSNPIQEISYYEGTKQLEASTSGLDFSDWKFLVKRARGTDKKVKYTTGAFTVSDVDSFSTGTQTVTFTSVENPSVSTKVTILVKESTKEKITIEKDLAFATEGDDLTKTIDGAEYKKMGTSGLVYGASTITGTAHADTYAATGMSFATRMTIKSRSSDVKVTMSAPGVIIAYIATSGTDIRELVALDPNGVEIGSYYTSSTKQEVVCVRITAETAGDYTLYATSNMYLHGIIISTNIEA